jgi:hypothetical protein
MALARCGKFIYIYDLVLGPLAQWLERLTHNQGVVGSSPTGTTFWGEKAR